MKEFEVEWGYYLQAYRLLQGLSRNSNAEAQQLLDDAITVGKGKGRVIARAPGLLSFALLNAWLCDWISVPLAEQIVEKCLEVVPEDNDEVGVSGMLQTLRQKGLHPDAAIQTVVRTYGYLARNLDESDFENHWSAATSDLYSRRWQDAQNGYEEAKSRTVDKDNNGLIPAIGLGSLAVDFADFRFFAGNEPLDDTKVGWIAVITKAIKETEAEQIKNSHDPKRFRWNWTLGWAYYELAAYEDPPGNLQKSRLALEQFVTPPHTPHDLIRKNLIATYTALGMTSHADRHATDFKKNNPHYTIAIEDRWPYRIDARRDRFKSHLAQGLGIPFTP